MDIVSFRKLHFRRALLLCHALLHPNQLVSDWGAPQLLSFLNSLYKGYQTPNTSVNVVHLNFSKAVDKIEHQYLLSKLEKIGVRGRLLKLLKSYISNRQQYASIGNAASCPLFVISGVPQGSLLGPLLILTYVLDFSADCSSAIHVRGRCQVVIYPWKLIGYSKWLFFPNGRLATCYLSTWISVIISFLERASHVP